MVNIKGGVNKEDGKLNLTQEDADAQQLPDISLILCLSQQLKMSWYHIPQSDKSQGNCERTPINQVKTVPDAFQLYLFIVLGMKVK